MKRLLLIVFSTCLLVATAFVATTSCSSNEPQDETLQTEELTTELTPEEQALNANLAAYTTDFFAGRDSVQSRGFGRFLWKICRAISISAADVCEFIESIWNEKSQVTSKGVAKLFDSVDESNHQSQYEGLRMNFDVSNNQEIQKEYDYCVDIILNSNKSIWEVQGAIHNVSIISDLKNKRLEAPVRNALVEYNSELIPRMEPGEVHLEINANTTYHDIINAYKKQGTALPVDFQYVENYLDGIACCESIEECFQFYTGYLDVIDNETSLDNERRRYIKGMINFVTRSMSMWYLMIEDAKER